MLALLLLVAVAASSFQTVLALSIDNPIGSQAPRRLLALGRQLRGEGPDVGAIVGGTFGGIAGLLLLIAATLYLFRAWQQAAFQAKHKDELTLHKYVANGSSRSPSGRPSVDELPGAGAGAGAATGKLLQAYTRQQIADGLAAYGQQVLGKGDYATVYRARLEGQEVAVKVLQGEQGLDVGALLRRELFVFQGGEAHHPPRAKSSLLSHPHLVALRGHCLEERALVFEYCAGGSLYAALKDPQAASRLSWRRRLALALQVATAVDYLHSLRPEPVLHRDLKPRSVLLDAGLACAKLGDVGVAFMPNSSTADGAPAPRGSASGRHHDSAATTVEAVPGTQKAVEHLDPDFMASGKFDRRSDVYGFGLIMCHLLTGCAELGGGEADGGGAAASSSGAGSGGGGAKGKVHHRVAAALEALERGDEAAFTSIIDPRSAAPSSATAPASAMVPWPTDLAKAFARLAVRCAVAKHSDRPLMDEVVAELQTLCAAAEVC